MKEEDKGTEISIFECEASCSTRFLTVSLVTGLKTATTDCLKLMLMPMLLAKHKHQFLCLKT